MKNYIADSSVWISYFEKHAACTELIEKNSIKTPSVVIAEVVKMLHQKKASPELQEKALEFIFNHSIILPLDFNQAVKAGKIIIAEKMPFADAIIYSYA